MQAKVWLVLLVTAAFCSPSLFAARSHQYPGHRWNPVFWAVNGAFGPAPTGLHYGRYQYIILTNVSETTQTVSIDGTLSEAKFWINGACGNQAFPAQISFRELNIGNWDDFSGGYAPQMLSAATNTSTITLSNLVLGPRSGTSYRKEIGFAAEYWGPLPNCPPTPEGTFSFRVRVDEDRGAVLAVVNEKTHCHGGCIDTSNGFNLSLAIDALSNLSVPLNGGRPF